MVAQHKEKESDSASSAQGIATSGDHDGAEFNGYLVSFLIHRQNRALTCARSAYFIMPIDWVGF